MATQHVNVAQQHQVESIERFLIGLQYERASSSDPLHTILTRLTEVMVKLNEPVDGNASRVIYTTRNLGRMFEDVCTLADFIAGRVDHEYVPGFTLISKNCQPYWKLVGTRIEVSFATLMPKEREPMLEEKFAATDKTKYLISRAPEGVNPFVCTSIVELDLQADSTARGYEVNALVHLMDAALPHVTGGKAVTGIRRSHSYTQSR
jgi:hypothetical protein